MLLVTQLVRLMIAIVGGMLGVLVAQFVTGDWEKVFASGAAGVLFVFLLLEVIGGRDGDGGED